MKNTCWALLFTALVVPGVAFGQTNTGVQTTELQVSGNCGMCKARIERALLNSRGVVSAVWNPSTQQAVVKYRANKTTPELLRQQLCEAGHDTGQC